MRAQAHTGEPPVYSGAVGHSEPVGREPAPSDERPPIREQDLQAQERIEDELIMHLERDQFVQETSRPVPRAALGASASAGLWALRAFVVLVSAMVIYTFIAGLH